MSPGRGAIIRGFTPKDVHDSLVVIGALEALAGRLACNAASDAAIAEVRALRNRIRPARGDHPARLVAGRLGQARRRSVSAVARQ
jgi:DNA-binding GntR family transcriptional regulator